jgi:deoxyribonuclease-4
VVFHAGYYHDDPPVVVYGRIRERLQALAEQVSAEGLSICLRPETSGRASQFGSLDEVLRLSAEIAGVRPCIDWGHLYARGCGALNGYSAFGAVPDRVQEVLGKGALLDLHLHVQGMAYSQAGEHKHLNLGSSDLCYGELVRALRDWGVAGTVVCESPNLEEDALLLKQVYRQLGS